MSALPAAEHQSPACGACGAETWFDGDSFICDDCQLQFDPENLGASFLDSDAEACGKPCDNTWHGDNKIRLGIGYDCNPCQLQTGHKSLCWTGCEARRVEQ